MSELTNDGDRIERIEVPEGKYSTDVHGVFADDVVKFGVDIQPTFDVSKEEFFSNMHTDRKRMRFKSGTPAQAYMSGTRYRNPFHIRYTENGKSYQRKIK